MWKGPPHGPCIKPLPTGRLQITANDSLAMNYYSICDLGIFDERDNYHCRPGETDVVDLV
jgi:hypothetical protein